MSEFPVIMPDGTAFPFWDDVTEYAQVYHVAQEHADASDDGPGTEERPFVTINRAAQALRPGEKVVVHGGVYRECVRPAQGGTGPEAMIAYEAAPGEMVIVRGSERWAPEFAHSEGWRWGGIPSDEGTEDSVTVWCADLPAEWFVGYHPFLARNFSSEYTTFTRDWTTDEIHTFMKRRGMVFLDGRPLDQVYFPHELGATDLSATEGAFWVEDPGLRIHLRLRGDADPRRLSFEVTTREQAFAPLAAGLGYIRVSGFHFEHAADGIPVPQRAMVSASRGHHWIVEDNTIRWANAVGLDVGNETWHRRQPGPEEPSGGHILRRNAVGDCGICGIAAVGNNAHTLVEDNLVERIADKDIERVWECAGLKFHTCDTVLIRRNVFRHIRSAPGVWLDYLNRNSRITGNVFADIEGILGAVYIEVSHAPNVVDHNVVWDVRGTGRPGSGKGINVDTGELCVVAHNLLGTVRDEYAISVHLGQRDRVVGGRVGLCRRHKVMNNIVVDCRKRVFLGRAADNLCDGNLYDEHDDRTSLCIAHPEPRALLDLKAWQTYYGFDVHGGQARIEADFDPETLLLTLSIAGEVPTSVPVPDVYVEGEGLSPGPLALEPGRRVYRIEAGGPGIVR
jgi:hypothetical protein